MTKKTYNIYISVTSSSSPRFMYLRASHRIQGKKNDVIKIWALIITIQMNHTHLPSRAGITGPFEAEVPRNSVTSH
jgi:hypothetical protein